MIQHIIDKDILYAIIVRSDFKKEGIEFFTPNEFSQQLGYMNRPKNYIIDPHVHIRTTKESSYTQEVLIIRSGKIRVDFYTPEMQYFASEVLNQGDVILLADGGHGFEMLEPTEIFEIKQGPYNADIDKKRFETPACTPIKMYKS
jgi:hypothetical protein